MNNYQNFNNADYFNMYNNNYMYKNTKEVKSPLNLYDPYNGLIRGNLFKNLYDPYKAKEPFEIKPMNEQAKLLTYIDSLCFSLVDLNLYLDIYPNDKNALNLFNQYREEKEKATKEYESKYGSITLDSDSLNSYPWAWDDMPWPWNN